MLCSGESTSANNLLSTFVTYEINFHFLETKYCLEVLQQKEIKELYENEEDMSSVSANSDAKPSDLKQICESKCNNYLFHTSLWILHSPVPWHVLTESNLNNRQWSVFSTTASYYLLEEGVKLFECCAEKCSVYVNLPFKTKAII